MASFAVGEYTYIDLMPVRSRLPFHTRLTGIVLVQRYPPPSEETFVIQISPLILCLMVINIWSFSVRILVYTNTILSDQYGLLDFSQIYIPSISVAVMHSIWIFIGIFPVQSYFYFNCKKLSAMMCLPFIAGITLMLAFTFSWATDMIEIFSCFISALFTTIIVVFVILCVLWFRWSYIVGYRTGMETYYRTQWTEAMDLEDRFDYTMSNWQRRFLTKHQNKIPYDIETLIFAYYDEEKEEMSHTHIVIEELSSFN